MARHRHAEAQIVEDEDDDDEDDELGASAARDFFMARLAAARSAAADALAVIDEAIAYCVTPEEDRSGKKRRENLDTALEALGVASRAVEMADTEFQIVDPSEGEPDEDEEE